MATPEERTWDAQVAFRTVVVGQRVERESLAVALLSVISTAELVTRDSRGINASRDHKGFNERYPAMWAELEGRIWEMVTEGQSFLSIFEIVRDFTKSQLDYSPLNSDALMRRVIEQNAA